MIASSLLPVGMNAPPTLSLHERQCVAARSSPTHAPGPRSVVYDLRVIAVCSEGYTLSLAAAALQDLGLTNATDLDGAFWLWDRAGLPTISGSNRPRPARVLVPAHEIRISSRHARSGARCRVRRPGIVDEAVR